MTGHDHFRDAERHLNYAADASHEREERYHLARAQVHATLALAAWSAPVTLTQELVRAKVTGGAS